MTFRYVAGSDRLIAVARNDRAVILPASEKSRVDAVWSALDSENALQAVIDTLTRDGLLSTPAFAFAGRDGSAVQVVVRGDMEADVAGETVSGSAISTWTERRFEGSDSFALKVAGADADSHETLPLLGGVVFAATVSLGDASGVDAQQSAVSASDHVSRGQVGTSIGEAAEEPESDSSGDDSDEERSDRHAVSGGIDVQPAAGGAGAMLGAGLVGAGIGGASHGEADESLAEAGFGDQADVEKPASGNVAEPASTQLIDHVPGRDEEDEAYADRSEDTVIPSHEADHENGGDESSELENFEHENAEQNDRPEHNEGPDDFDAFIASGQNPTVQTPVVNDDPEDTVLGSSLPSRSAAEHGGQPNVLEVSLSNGEVYPFDAPIVIGRAPRGDQIEGDLDPRLITVTGDTDISRNHVALAIEGGTVVVTDLHSRNGTQITLPGRSPQQLRAGEATPIVVGTLIDFGGGTTATVREA